MWQQARLHPRRERLGLSMRERSLFRQAFGVFQEAAKEYEAESQADELLAAKRGRASPTKPQRAPPLNEREVNPNHTTRASSPGVVRGHKCALYRESRECREGVPVVESAPAPLNVRELDLASNLTSKRNSSPKLHNSENRSSNETSADPDPNPNARVNHKRSNHSPSPIQRFPPRPTSRSPSPQIQPERTSISPGGYIIPAARSPRSGSPSIDMRDLLHHDRIRQHYAHLEGFAGFRPEYDLPVDHRYGSPSSPRFRLQMPQQHCHA